MRLQGILSNWNDERGFGFVEPNGGGERAFVHIKAFKGTRQRPKDGDVINYDLMPQKNNKFRAENIKFATEKPNSRSKESGAGFVVVSILLLLLVISVVVGKLPAILLLWYVAISLLTFIVYVLDKSAAKRGAWRTQESTLHFLSLIGGWPGAFWAQSKIRHKSSKKEFLFVYWLTVTLNCCLIVWFHTKVGSLVLADILD